MCGIFAEIVYPGYHESACRMSSLLTHCLRLHPCPKQWCSVVCAQTKLPNGCIATIGLGRCYKKSSRKKGITAKIHKFGDISVITTNDIRELPKSNHDIVQQLWEQGASGVVCHPQKGIRSFAQPGELWQAKERGITIISSFTVNDWEKPQWEAVEGISAYQPGHILILQ